RDWSSDVCSSDLHSTRTRLALPMLIAGVGAGRVPDDLLRKGRLAHTGGPANNNQVARHHQPVRAVECVKAGRDATLPPCSRRFFCRSDEANGYVMNEATILAAGILGKRFMESGFEG